jgi:hypothetical protein
VTLPPKNPIRIPGIEEEEITTKTAAVAAIQETAIAIAIVTAEGEVAVQSAKKLSQKFLPMTY